MNEEMLNKELALLKLYGHSGINAEKKRLIFSIDNRVPRCIGGSRRRSPAHKKLDALDLQTMLKDAEHRAELKQRDSRNDRRHRPA